jgi:hypothetical protein
MPQGPKGEMRPAEVIGAAAWSAGSPLARLRKALVYLEAGWLIRPHNVLNFCLSAIYCAPQV